jgi:diguanylate cyclase (GGDEF)-like protein/PAS domain S-box-containing protein
MLTNKIRVKNKLYNLNIPFSLIAAFFAILLFSEIFLSIYYYVRFDSFFINAKEKELIRIVDIAYAACSHVIDQKIKNEIDSGTAEKNLASIISKMTHCKEMGLNYLFLIKRDGTILVNPKNNIIPVANIFYLNDRDGQYYINEILRAAYSDKKSGFINFSNEYPDKSGRNLKISYVRSLPSVDCIIGSGTYIDRMLKDQKAILFPIIIGSISIIAFIIILAVLSLLKIKKNLNILQISEDIFKSVFNKIDHHIALLDSKLNVLMLNETALQLIGSKGNQYEGMPFVKLPIWTDNNGSRETLKQLIMQMNNGRIKRHQLVIRDRNGSDRYIDFSIYPLDYSDNQPRLYIADGKDITELKEKENEIYSFAFTDQVTNLPNEQLFSQMVTGFLKSGDQAGALIAIIKLSNLSFINSMRGFAIGNEMLRSFTERLIHISSAGCIVAKFSGGNFAIYIPSNIAKTRKEEIFNLFEKLCSDKSRPLKFGEHEMHVNVLIGVATFPEHGSDYPELIHSAMMAKDNSNGLLDKNFQVFDQDIANKIRRRSRIEEAVRSPGIENSMSVHFQPQVDLKNGKIDSFEALVRWHDEKIGNVSPLEFIPIAEKIGVINRIFSFVLARSGVIVNKVNGYGIRISVNVSVVQLIDEIFPDMLISITRQCGIMPSSITIEITESILIESFESAVSMLRKLKSMGYLISLDDFGTGFSSLSYLRNLPVDVLKIDKTFIHGIESDEKTATLVRSIIIIAHELDMKVVAEGVETKEQASLLRDIGCDFSQGWYTGKPMTEEEAINIVKCPSLVNEYLPN